MLRHQQDWPSHQDLVKALESAPLSARAVMRECIPIRVLRTPQTLRRGRITMSLAMYEKGWIL